MRAPGQPNGFTLLELMIALVVFAVGTLAAMDVLHRAQAGSTDGEHTLLATHAGQQCLEALRNIAYGSLTVGPGVMSGTIGCGATISSLPSGSRSVTISEQPSTNLKRLTVTVTWQPPGSGSTTNVALQTYRAGV